ncbi:MAG: BMP family ABC transporter substrate-binding protein [Actinomycetota bacterium]|nr:BMP family ABC transporter substrate-binding protein [Actinomycetota bacterium]MDQ6949461.1 BMP family ABC transporter substrate-binding protein [Actinomycetota bacterium]
MTRRTKTASVAFVVLVVAAACSKSTNTTTSSTTANSTTASTAAPGRGATTTTGPSSTGTLTACMVTDTGGIDDRSFNASSYQGLTDAKSVDPNITTKYVQSTSQSDYVPNINSLIAQKCGIIVTVGFLMGDATQAAAKANPTQNFAIVDFSYTTPLPNVKALVFNTAQAGFLGGYLAAGMSKTGSVATFGGIKLPTVTIYMDGYAEGVAYYNTKHNTQVKVLGWDEKAKNGTFTGDFTDQGKGKNVTQTFIQQGADIIFPVAGNVGLGAAAAVQQNGNGVHMLWVDTDGCVSAPQYCSVFISSVEKGIAVAVKQAVLDAANGAFKGGNYIGTLANNGVGLAPFHNFQSQVPPTLQSELDQVKQGIITGSITITSPSQPTS